MKAIKVKADRPAILVVVAETVIKVAIEMTEAAIETIEVVTEDHRVAGFS
jgi:hypothetical protein